MPTGTAIIDFGAFPGKTDASLDVTGQAAITAGSFVEAWIRPANTSDHSADEHVVDPPRVVAGNIAAGVGFTIYAVSAHGDGCWSASKQNPRAPMPYGKWTVAWVWTT